MAGIQFWSRLNSLQTISLIASLSVSIWSQLNWILGEFFQCTKTKVLVTRNRSRGTKWSDLISFLSLLLQSTKLDAANSGSLSYVHKIHGAAKLDCRNGSEGSSKPNELWSVAKLSLECNNSSKEDTRQSFYQQLNQMQQRSFHHHLDVSSSTSH